MKPNIELHIDELVLRGFRSEDRQRIGAAVEAELTRLLAARGVAPPSAAGGDTPRIDGGAFRVAHDAAAETIGTQVAQGVYGGLNR